MPIVRNQDQVAVMPYRYCRELCHAVKNGNEYAIKIAAELMSTMMPYGELSKDYVLVPIPSHYGMANYTLELAQWINKLTKIPVCNCLCGENRESLYSLRKQGKEIPQDFVTFKLGLYDELPKGKKVIFVDNVIATGTTYEAAKKVIPNAEGIIAIGLDTSLQYAVHTRISLPITLPRFN